jgi:hypothetical protein
MVSSERNEPEPAELTSPVQLREPTVKAGAFVVRVSPGTSERTVLKLARCWADAMDVAAIAVPAARTIFVVFIIVFALPQ